MADLIIQPSPPIMLEPGLRFVASGTTSDGQVWMKFVNINQGRVREVVVTIVATAFMYHYAMRDPSTGTISAYEGPHGDPTKDESYLYGSP